MQVIVTNGGLKLRICVNEDQEQAAEQLKAKPYRYTFFRDSKDMLMLGYNYGTTTAEMYCYKLDGNIQVSGKASSSTLPLNQKAFTYMTALVSSFLPYFDFLVEDLVHSTSCQFEASAHQVVCNNGDTIEFDFAHCQIKWNDQYFKSRFNLHQQQVTQQIDAIDQESVDIEKVLSQDVDDRILQSALVQALVLTQASEQHFSIFENEVLSTTSRACDGKAATSTQEQQLLCLLLKLKAPIALCGLKQYVLENGITLPVVNMLVESDVKGSEFYYRLYHRVLVTVQTEFQSTLKIKKEKQQPWYSNLIPKSARSKYLVNDDVHDATPQENSNCIEVPSEIQNLFTPRTRAKVVRRKSTAKNIADIAVMVRFQNIYIMSIQHSCFINRLVKTTSYHTYLR